MGRHKAFLEYSGRRFIDVIWDNMKAWFDDIFIVTNDKELFSEVYEPVFEDIIPGKGPLGAIYTALTVAKKERVFCVACDMPRPYDPVIAEVVRASRKDGYDCFVPRGPSGPEPLFAIYKKGLIDLMEEEIRAGQLCISKALEKGRAYYIDLAAKGEGLVNINTPQEYIRHGRGV